MEKYEKVWIKSANDLPKEDGDYIVHSKSFGWIGQANWKNYENANYPEYKQYLWLLNYDWYLQFISDTELIVPSDEEIDNEMTDGVICDWGHNAIAEYYDKIEERIIGAKWAIAKIKKLNKEER